MDNVFLGAGNFTALKLSLGGVQQNLSQETRFIIEIDGVNVLDSSTAPTLFDWETDPTLLSVKLGGVAVTPGPHVLEIKSYNAVVSPYFSWGSLTLNFA